LIHWRSWGGQQGPWPPLTFPKSLSIYVYLCVKKNKNTSNSSKPAIGRLNGEPKSKMAETNSPKACLRHCLCHCSTPPPERFVFVRFAFSRPERLVRLCPRWSHLRQEIAPSPGLANGGRFRLRAVHVGDRSRSEYDSSDADERSSSCSRRKSLVQLPYILVNAIRDYNFLFVS
jgi:hypothetical protein